MFNLLQTCGVIALLLCAFPNFATEQSQQTIAVVTLENGTKVKLKDDFTWQYIFDEPQAVQHQSAVTASSPVTTEKYTTPMPTESLSANAINQAELLKTTAKDGVKVSYLSSQWNRKGELGLNFQLDSQSDDSYVQIKLEISLFDDKGKLLTKETLPVWQAIYRMPDTYLRKGQSRESGTLWIKGVEQSQWNKRLLTLKIEEMESR